MVSFDTSQTLLFNVGIDVFSVCIILILITFCKWNTAESQDKRIFFRLQIMILATLITDMIMWIVNGIPGSLARIIGYANNMVYYFSELLVLLEWLCYSYFRIYEKYMPRKTEVFAIMLPLSIISLCIITTPLTGWCFYLDEYNIYHRGTLSFTISLVCLVYLFLSSTAALLQRKKETLFNRKRECSILGFFAITPLLGGCMQTILYGCSLIWPCVSLSALLLFINMENQAISLDALTRLNNRGNLDRYLHTGLEIGQSVSLIMLDINNFKMFNDRYGHEMGDRALVQTTNILKNTFRGSSAFLSRYGGDEFVVVLPGYSKEETECAIKDFQESIEVFNKTHALPYSLSASIGFAVRTISGPKDVSRLLKEADEQMYKQKRYFHKAENSLEPF